MPGSKITDRQVYKYMIHKKTNSQSVAAAKAGISERSARRIDKGELQPNSGPRQWRTRKDPLAAVWEPIVVPLLMQDDLISPVGIFDHLCADHPEIFNSSSRRTLERRISSWRARHGVDQDIVFLQTHEYGNLGICDFTHIKFDVVIAGEVVMHMLFHYRMPASGWAYTQVIYGGESFAALSDGLQRAFKAAGGVPQKVRTDSLSAAYKNNGGKTTFTERYQELARHWNFKPTRNNKGIAHENGAIESPHGHVKAQVEQALRIRGSFAFNTRDDYETFVIDVVERRNSRIKQRLIQEQRQLQPLPLHLSVNYDQLYVSVRRTSTIVVKRVTYTVPASYAGHKLLVHLYDDHLDLFLGTDKVLTLDRVYALPKRRARSVNYKHVIDALAKKPQAFRCSQIRDDLFPSDNYRSIWLHVDQHMAADEANHYFVKLLQLAKRSNQERLLSDYVLAGIAQGLLPSIKLCQEQFLDIQIPEIKLSVVQHDLSVYGELARGTMHG